MAIEGASPELSRLITMCFGEENTTQAAEPINWDYFLHLSRFNGIQALIADRLGQFPDIPLHVASEIKQNSVWQSMHNLMAMRKMLDVYRCLHDAGIGVFPMKGPLWGWLYYGNSGLRSFGDLDFFIDEKQLIRGTEALKKIGFSLDGYRDYLLSEKKLTEAYVRTDYQLAFSPGSVDDVKLLELQWRNTYPRFGRFFSYNELMDQPLDYTIHGDKVRVPRPEYQFLMLAIHHGLVEQWGRLKYMLDLVFFLRKHAGDLDWDFVWSAASDKGIKKIILLGLYLAKEIAPTLQIPSNISFQSIKDYPLKSVYYTWEHEIPKSLTKSMRILHYNIKYREGWVNKISLLKGHFRYLAEWKLLWYKARWYNRKY